MSETLSLVEQVKAAMKAAMKAREKETLSTIRLIQAEFKRVEVDERIDCLLYTSPSPRDRG